MHQETSYLAWDSIQIKLGIRQNQVFEVLMSGNRTNEEIAEALNWPINTVTPRTGELVKKGIVVQKGHKFSRSGRKAIVWGLKSES